MSEVMVWRDMASAPKDATEIILRIPSQGWPDHYAQIGHWAQDLSGEEQPPFRGWFRKTGYGCAELADPTGWRPLFGDARPVEERFDFDAHSLKVDLAREIKRAETAEAEVKRLTRELRMIVSHATAGRTDGAGMSVNDVCVAITALRNELWQEARKKPEAALAETRERLEKERDAGFNHGYLMAVANIINLHRETVVAADVLLQIDLTIDDAEAFELAEYDMDALNRLRAEPRAADFFKSQRREGDAQEAGR